MPVSHDEVLETALVPVASIAELDEGAPIELRRTDDDRMAMLAYTSLPQLVRGCGDRQPWIAVALDQVDELRARAGADLLLWDAELDADMRHRR